MRIPIRHCLLLFLVSCVLNAGCGGPKHRQDKGEKPSDSNNLSEMEVSQCPPAEKIKGLIGYNVQQVNDSFPALTFASFFDEPPGHMRGMLFTFNDRVYQLYLLQEWGDEWFSQELDWKYDDFSKKEVEMILVESLVSK